MTKRALNIAATVLLIISATLVVWQGSFDFGAFRPSDSEQTFLFFAVSLVIFLLTITLGFMLVKILLRTWFDRQTGRPGSRIRTKLLFGALALSLMPVLFMVLFNYEVMNRTLQRWFTGPQEHVVADFQKILAAIEQQTRGKALAEAQLIAALPETQEQIEMRGSDSAWLTAFCTARGINAVRILPLDSMEPAAVFGRFPANADTPNVSAMAPILRRGLNIGSVVVNESLPVNAAKLVKDIGTDVKAFQQLADQRRLVRRNYVQVIFLIALFIFFAARRIRRREEGGGGVHDSVRDRGRH
jgi:nitrogen fixation/metabolism regulation signal transduction histidine kinase